jgi:hypothetical protein
MTRCWRSRDEGSLMRLRAFLTSVMSLLSILVFFLASIYHDMFWLWVSFLCILISGVYVQLFIDARRRHR